mgnify:CR=1 FL=1
MIQVSSRLKVADNSGAISVQCIKVLGGSRKKIASLGDLIVVSVKKVRPNGKIKKGAISKAVIIRQKKGIQRSDGYKFFSDDNAVVLVNAEGAPKSTRIFGPVSRELKKKQFLKITSLAPYII